MGHCVVRVCAALCVCAPVSLASPGAAGQGRIEPEVVESLWLTAESGLFLDPARWSGGAAPNNTTETEYDAVINAAGAAYTVTLEGGDVSLRSLTIDSLGATMRHLSGTLDVSGMIDIKQGVYELGNATIKNATIRQSGGAFRVATTSSTVATLENVTLEGGVFDFSQSNTRIAVRGDLTLDGASIEIGGASARLFLEEARAIRGGEVRLVTPRWEVTTSAEQSLVIAADASIAMTSSGIWHGGGATVINHGRFTVYRPTHVSTNLDIRSLGAFHNHGVIEATGWGNLPIRAELWSNTGQILASDSSRIQLFGDGLNQGSIESSGSAEITVGSGVWTNNGVIVAHDNSRMVLEGSWSNNGVIRSEGGRIILGGQFTIDQLGTIETQVAGYEITGTMDNSGNTLSLTSASTPITLSGGTITGGEIVIDHNDRLIITGSTRSRFRDLILSGNIAIPVNRELALSNVHYSEGTITGAGGSRLIITGDTSLGGVIVLNGGTLMASESDAELNDVSIHLNSGLNGSGHMAPGRIEPGHHALTIGEDVLITGSDGAIGSHGWNGIAIHHGHILSAGPDAVISIDGRFQNHGLIEAVGGGRILMRLGTGDLQNHGTIRAGEGGTIATWGSFTVADFLALGITREIGGHVAILGAMSNNNNIFVIDETVGDLLLGPVEFGANVSIFGGEVYFYDGYRLVGRGGTLSNITIHAGGDFVLDRPNEHFRFSGSGVNIAGGDLVLSAAGTIVEFLDGTTWDKYNIYAAPVDGETGRQLRLGVSHPPGSATYTLSEGHAIHGGNLVIDGIDSHLINHGVIRNDWEGSVMNITGLPMFTNHNLVVAENGARVTVSPALWTNHGLAEAVEGSELAIGAASWSNFGEIRARGGSTLSLITMPDTVGDISIIDSTLKLGAFSTPVLSEFQFQGDSGLLVTGVWQNTGSSFSTGADSLALSLQNGTIQGGSIDLAGADLTIKTGGTLQNVALSGGDVVLDAAGTLRHSGTVSLSGGSVRLRAGGANLSVVSGVSTIDYNLSLEAPDGGFSTISLTSSSLNTITAGSVVRGGNANILGSQARLTNHGVISADREGAIITVATVGGQFTNHGVVEARDGGVFQGILTNFTNIAGGTLTGGTWRVFDGSEIDLSEYTITKNAANVELHGADSRFAAINALRENAGRFGLFEGRQFDALAGRSGDVFTNTGEVALGVGSGLHVHGDYAAGEGAAHVFHLGAAGASGLLAVAGTAALDGELRLLLGEGFSGALGASWTLVTAGQLVGGFSSFAAPSLGGGLSLAVSSGAGSISVSVIPAPGAAGTLLLTLVIAVRRRRAA